MVISHLSDNLIGFNDEASNLFWQVELSPELDYEYKAYTTKVSVPMSFPEWLARKTRPKKIAPPPLPDNSKQKFVEALEQAFWAADGPAKLIDLANKNPLEFLKICAKLIPVDAADKTPKGGLSVTFNIQDPKQGGKIIDHQSDDFS